VRITSNLLQIQQLNVPFRTRSHRCLKFFEKETPVNPSPNSQPASKYVNNTRAKRAKRIKQYKRFYITTLRQEDAHFLPLFRASAKHQIFRRKMDQGTI
jgi:hypothetical protein